MAGSTLAYSQAHTPMNNIFVCNSLFRTELANKVVHVVLQAHQALTLRENLATAHSNPETLLAGAVHLTHR
jgi:hypothetical protein